MDFDKALYDFMETHDVSIVLRPARGGFEATLLDPDMEASGDSRGVIDAISAAITAYNAQLTGMTPNRKWTTRYKDQLPDSAFLYVRKDCVTSKDAQGRSHPLSCRDLPIRDMEGRYDYDHVRNAISRALVLKGVSAKVKRQLQDEACRIFRREFP